MYPASSGSDCLSPSGVLTTFTGHNNASLFCYTWLAQSPPTPPHPTSVLWSWLLIALMSNIDLMSSTPVMHHGGNGTARLLVSNTTLVIPTIQQRHKADGRPIKAVDRYSFVRFTGHISILCCLMRDSPRVTRMVWWAHISSRSSGGLNNLTRMFQTSKLSPLRITLICVSQKDQSMYESSGKILRSLYLNTIHRY